MDRTARVAPRRATIGIVAGSGPEAGIDLWAKILRRNAAVLGPAFRGDLDAPRVVVLSEPQLGLSMDLANNEGPVWEAMQSTATRIAAQSDAWAIACNTLNWFAPRIASLGLTADFVSFPGVVADWIPSSGIHRLGLLGAAPVTEMGAWSAYRDLAGLVEIETPADLGALQDLIYDVKRLGSADPGLRPRFARIVEAMQADTLLLACTELPLIADFPTSKTLVDVTDLVADALVARSLAGGDRATMTPAQQENDA
ncbi:aspartate/glutamate racemase family protein [Fuscovulum ytuae]|uniref:Aspartate/glutamate racemase family protein n=1 Tax=Fuscovulum ytuae TaxID=3042299 RepID=A0ABY8Q8W3_9RHOB|nr:aspartate/glutamate racemase family protein [Fuscovulum sp. YMD61]WGV17318.1 aspartate/glutamate racemase family protein [Fuscovulum sp. YMD61]